MKLHIALAAVIGIGSAVTAGAEPTSQHAAACVAALQPVAEVLAHEYRSGKVEVESELLTRVQQGFAFIGVAYKQGLRKEEADQLLKEAEKAQEQLSAEELAARQSACSSEGAQLLANANPLERAFVVGAARRRVDKLKRAG
jgi:hypothetical protein